MFVCLPVFTVLCVSVHPPFIRNARGHMRWLKHFHCRFDICWCDRRMWYSATLMHLKIPVVNTEYACHHHHHHHYCLVNNRILSVYFLFWFIERISQIAICTANRHARTHSHTNLIFLLFFSSFIHIVHIPRVSTLLLLSLPPYCLWCSKHLTTRYLILSFNTHKQTH